MAFNSYMHERNIYKNRQNFEQIGMDFPEFRRYLIYDEKGKIRIDFTDTNTLRLLTKILLKKDFNLDIEIPLGFLIPTVPQRLNYVLWIEDLLSLLPHRSSEIRGIDIGTGPCAIFSILGAKKNGWNFISTESSLESIQWAKKNIESNNLKSHIEIVKVNEDSFLEEVLSASNIVYDFCLCNPPFFENIDEIKKKNSRAKKSIAEVAKATEIISQGGEVHFVKKIIENSLKYKNRVRFYTSMFGKKTSFLQILSNLQNIKDVQYTNTEFCQGNTIRWGLAWTFCHSIDLSKMDKPKSKKVKKAKPPLIFEIPRTKKVSVKETLKKLKEFLHNVEIQTKDLKCAENYAEIQVAANKNTWSHQRQKRRKDSKKQNEDSDMSDLTVISQSSHDVSPKQTETGEESSNSPKKLAAEVKEENTSSSKKRTAEADEENGGDCKKQRINADDKVHLNWKTIKEECPQSTWSHQKPKEREDSKNQTEGTDKSFLTVISQSSNDVSSKQMETGEESGSSPKKHITDVKEENANSPKKSGAEASEVNDGNCGKERIDTVEEIKLNSESVKEECPQFEFDPHSLLFSVIKLRKQKDSITFELNCPSGSNRDSMYQVLQYLKNKFV